MCLCSSLDRKEGALVYQIPQGVVCLLWLEVITWSRETLQALLAFGISENFPMSGGWGEGREGLWAVVELSGMPGCIRSIK